MKRYKRILILAIVLMATCIATFALTQYEEKQEQIRTSDEIVLQIPSENVRSLSWEYSGGSGLAFNKTNDGWKYQDDETFPVSEEKILAILEQFEEFGATFVIEDVTDEAMYGLKDPVCTLHLTTAEGSYNIKLGDYSTMDAQRYISIEDGNVYLVESDPLDYVTPNLSAMILHDDTPGFERVVDITFSGSENYTIVRIDESTATYAPEEDIYFTEHSGRRVPLDTDTVRTYLNTITSLDLVTYASYNVTQAELSAFGLDAPLLSVTVNYTYTNGNDETVEDTCILHIGEDIEERAACDAAVAEGNTATSVTKYVRIGDSQIIYTLDDTNFSIMEAANFDDLRHKEVFWADFELVEQIDIALEGEEHTLTKGAEEPDAEDSTYVWFYDEKVIGIDDVQSALNALSANRFTKEPPSKEEEIGITLHLNNENFPTVEIRLYRYDGSECLVVVDGDPVSLVDRSCVMDLVEAVQAIVLSD